MSETIGIGLTPIETARLLHIVSVYIGDHADTGHADDVRFARALREALAERLKSLDYGRTPTP